jgi:septum formation topological specificity factor MinE
MRTIADTRFANRTMRNYLHTWMLKTQQTQYYASTNQMADRYRRISLLTKMIRQWYLECVMKQESDYKWELALHHDRIRLMGKCMKALKQYIVHRRHDAQDNTLARDTARIIILTRALTTWRERTDLSIQDNDLLRRALVFFRRRNIVRFIRKWKSVLGHRRDKNILMSKAKETNKLLIKMKFMRKWKAEMERVLLEKQHEDEFISDIRDRLDHNLLRRAFKSWRSYHDTISLSKAKAALAFNTYNHALLFKCLRAWIMYMDTRRFKRERHDKAMIHLIPTLGKRYLLKWRDRLRIALIEHEKERRAQSLHNVKLQQHALQLWKKFIEIRKNKVKRRMEAAQLRSDLLLRRGVSQWVEAGIEKRQLRLDYKSKYESLQNRRIMFFVEKCARHWHYLTLKNKKERRYPLSNKLYPKVIPSSQISQNMVPPSENILPAPFLGGHRRTPPRPLPIEYMSVAKTHKPQPPVIVPALPPFMQPPTVSAPLSARSLPTHEEIEHINALGKELQWFTDFTPKYEKEKRDRLRIREVLTTTDGQPISSSEQQALERVLSMLEGRAKKYVAFKRETLPVITQAIQQYKERFRDVE